MWPSFCLRSSETFSWLGWCFCCWWWMWWFSPVGIWQILWGVLGLWLQLWRWIFFFFFFFLQSWADRHITPNLIWLFMLPVFLNVFVFSVQVMQGDVSSSLSQLDACSSVYSDVWILIIAVQKAGIPVDPLTDLWPRQKKKTPLVPSTVPTRDFNLVLSECREKNWTQESWAQAKWNNITYSMKILGMWAWLTKNLRCQGNTKVHRPVRRHQEN